MATYTISPSNDVRNGDEPGQFYLPENATDKDIVYTVTYTDDNGCTATQDYTVMAKPLPPTPEKTTIAVSKGDVFHGTCAEKETPQKIIFEFNPNIALSKGEKLTIRLTTSEQKSTNGEIYITNCYSSDSRQNVIYDFEFSETKTSGSFKTLEWSPTEPIKVTFDKADIIKAECISPTPIRYEFIWSK